MTQLAWQHVGKIAFNTSPRPFSSASLRYACTTGDVPLPVVGKVDSYLAEFALLLCGELGLRGSALHGGEGVHTDHLQDSEQGSLRQLNLDLKG